MKTVINQNVLKQKGGSVLISSLIAFGIMGFSSMVLITYMGSFRAQVQQSVEKETTGFNIHSKVILSLQSLLIETGIDNSGNKTDQSIWGVCSLLKSPNKMSGVELIQFNLSANLTGRANDSFSSQRWEVFFDQSEYTLSSKKAPCKAIDSSFQSSHFSRCFKYIGKQSDTANETYVVAHIVPEQFPNFTPIDLSRENILDVKTVVFKLKSYVAVFKGNDYSSILSPSKQYEIVWANSVSECQIQSTNNNNWVVVQFSGSGTGRLSRRTIINSAEFIDPNTCSDLEFGTIPTHTVTAYKKVSDGTILPDSDSYTRIACTRKVYRCPGKESSVDDYSPFIFNMAMSNDSGGTLSLKETKLTFVDDKSNEVDSTSDGKINTLNVGIYDIDENKDLTMGQTIAHDINVGQSVFRFTLKDKNPGSLKSFCDDVCSGDEYFPSIKMNLKKATGAPCTSYSSDYTEDKYRMRCIVCHSKICNTTGLGVFGPISDEGTIQGLVDEPLDGIIPECALKKSIEYKLPSSVSSGSGNCVAMKATSLNSFKDFDSSSSNPPQYEFHKCDTLLPVLCFAYGHYLPAMTITSSGTKPTVFKGSFNKAQEACYKMGREIIKKVDLLAYFKAAWDNLSISDLGRLPSPSGTNYFDYVNNASRGIFLVPSYKISVLSNRLSQDSSSYLQKFISSKHDKLWVAMEKDAGSQLIGSIPLATKADSAFSIFKKKTVRDPITGKITEDSHIVVLEDTNDISHSDSGTDTVLTHNIRYKGVYNVSGGSYDILCRKSAGVFLRASSTSIANAPRACGDEGAAFLPPMSSLEWVKAMSLLNGNDERYPFPDPGDLSGNYSHSLSVSAPKAYVALSRAAGGGDRLSAKNWRLSKAWFPDSDSIFNTESIPDPADSNNPPYCDPNVHYIGIIDYRGKPVMPSDMSWNAFVNFNFNNYKKACFTGPGQQVKLKDNPISASGTCADKEVNTDNLLGTKNLMKSIQFMSQWVQKYTNTSDKFIIDKRLIDETIIQAKRKQCKHSCNNTNHNCSKANNTCRSACNSNSNSCRNPCYLDPPLPPEERRECISDCSDSKKECRGTCSRNFTSCVNSCKNNCNTNQVYNISGHVCDRDF